LLALNHDIAYLQGDYDQSDMRAIGLAHYDVKGMMMKTGLTLNNFLRKIGLGYKPVSTLDQQNEAQLAIRLIKTKPQFLELYRKYQLPLPT
jgi:hypothetical protein